MESFALTVVGAGVIHWPFIKNPLAYYKCKNLQLGMHSIPDSRILPCSDVFS